MPFLLRSLKLPEDYAQLAQLFQLIRNEPVDAEALAQEDRSLPAQNRLSRSNSGLLEGFGRERVVVESDSDGIIGYGVAWRAPWTDPGALASLYCVHPDFCKQGVGQMILAHIEKWAQDIGAKLLMSEVKDWVPDSLPFFLNRGYTVDAHVFELVLDLQSFDRTLLSAIQEAGNDRDIRYLALGEASDTETRQKLYDLYRETLIDNPGFVGSLPDFDQWQTEALPNDRQVHVFVAVDQDRFVGVTTLFATDEPGLFYTDYTGVSKAYRGRRIATTLKLRSIQAAWKAGAHTLYTDTEAGNKPMQAVNRGLGYVPGRGAYRILKHI